MRGYTTSMLVAALLATLGGCSMSLNERDRALLTSMSEHAQEAKDLAQQALAAAQSAQASALSAAQEANQAELDTQAANEKADIVAHESRRKSN